MLRESQRTQAEEEVSNLVFAVKKIGESEIKNGKSTRDEQSLRFLHIPLLLGNGKWPTQFKNSIQLNYNEKEVIV